MRSRNAVENEIEATRMFRWLGNYAVTLFLNWYGLILAAVGLVRIIEWFLSRTLTLLCHKN